MRWSFPRTPRRLGPPSSLKNIKQAYTKMRHLKKGKFENFLPSRAPRECFPGLWLSASLAFWRHLIAYAIKVTGLRAKISDTNRHKPRYRRALWRHVCGRPPSSAYRTLGLLHKSRQPYVNHAQNMHHFDFERFLRPVTLTFNILIRTEIDTLLLLLSRETFTWRQFVFLAFDRVSRPYGTDGRTDK